jgi:hypothetical protein
MLGGVFRSADSLTLAIAWLSALSAALTEPALTGPAAVDVPGGKRL